ncbi:MAG: hypothetical protein WAQ98_16460 [Blastocatellia bacterium]
MKWIWIIRGEVLEIEKKGIKVISEEGEKLFFLKRNYDEGYNFDFDKLKLGVGDKIEAQGLPVELRHPVPYVAEWLSKAILLDSKKVLKTITLHPSYPEPIILDNYYNGILGYRGKIKKIRKDGIVVFPDNLTGHPGEDRLILKQNGDYKFNFSKLNFQIGDKIETSITKVEQEWKAVEIEWVKKEAKEGLTAMTLSVSYPHLY